MVDYELDLTQSSLWKRRGYSKNYLQQKRMIYNYTQKRIANKKNKTVRTNILPKIQKNTIENYDCKNINRENYNNYNNYNSYNYNNINKRSLSGVSSTIKKFEYMSSNNEIKNTVRNSSTNNTSKYNRDLNNRRNNYSSNFFNRFTNRYRNR